MPKRKRKRQRKPKVVKPELVVKRKTFDERSPEDLQAFIREADEVKQLTTMPGWGILERDLVKYQSGIINKLVYSNPNRPEYDEARVLFIAIDKILALVNDYQENRDKAIELLDKLENKDLSITMDVDNEI